MDLRNFEYVAGAGTPISGATVTVYEAILTGSHGAALSFTDHNANVGTSTTTNSDGMWEANGLPDGQFYDVKVEHNGRIKWYKGRTMHVVEQLHDDESPDPNRNLIPNGGLDHWLKAGSGAVTLPTSDPGAENVADGWVAHLGSGDSGTGQRESTTVATDSQYSLKVAYTRSGGQATVYRELPAPIWQQLRGKTVTLSIAVYQEAASSKLAAFVDDGLGTTTGTVTDVVGSWTIISVTHAVSASATKVRLGVVTARTDTGARNFYVDNAMADLGANAPTFAPELLDVVGEGAVSLSDSTAPTGDGGRLSTVLGWLANRIKAITGEAGWRDNPDSTITALLASISSLSSSLTSGLALKVAKAGDSMSGNLTFSLDTGTLWSSGGRMVDSSFFGSTTIQCYQNALKIYNAAATTQLFRAQESESAPYFKNTALSLDGHTHSGTAKIESGSYSGNNAGARSISISAGFTPKFVFVLGNTHQSGLIVTGASSWLILDHTGGPTFDEITDQAGNISAGAFTVAATLNVSPRTYLWVAIG